MHTRVTAKNMRDFFYETQFMSKCTRHKIDNFRDAVFLASRLAGNEETKSNTSNTTNM